MVWLKSALFALFVPGVTLGLVPYLITRNDGGADPPQVLRWLGVTLVALGVTVMGVCFTRFARARGTPAPIDPPKELVVVGLYRWVRNPMYLGAFAILLGQVLLNRSRELAVYAAAFALSCHLFVVLYEERALARQFGASYDRYRATVRRWLPRRPASTPRET